MWSTVVMFVLTFAILGLLLGIAEVYDPAGTGGDSAALEPEAGNTSNATSTQEFGDAANATGD